MEQKKWVIIYSHTFYGGNGSGHCHATGELTPELRQMIRAHILGVITKDDSRIIPSTVALSITGIYQLTNDTNHA
jgi:hypothetical protein